MHDMGMKYNSCKISIENLISKIEKLNFDVKYYQNRVDFVEHELQGKIKDCMFNNDSLFNVDIFNQIYGDGIKELNKLSNKLIEKYDDYYKMVNLNEYIDHFVHGDNFDDINTYVNEGITLLNCMENSSTLIYESEKSIIESVYNTIYKLLLLEAYYSNRSMLLDRVKASSMSSSYINSMLEEKIMEIKDKKVKSNIHKLNSKNGLETNYLDKDTLKLIAKKNNLSKVNTDNDVSDSINYISNQVDIVKSKYNKILDIEELKDIKRGVTGGALVFGAVLSAIAAVDALVIGCAEHDETKVYSIETNVDDENDVNIIDRKYVDLTDYELEDYVVEYSPWKSQDGKNFRDVYKYDYATNSSEQCEKLYLENPDTYEKEIELSEKLGEVVMPGKNYLEYNMDVYNYNLGLVSPVDLSNNDTSYYYHVDKVDAYDIKNVEGFSHIDLATFIILNVIFGTSLAGIGSIPLMISFDHLRKFDHDNKGLIEKIRKDRDNSRTELKILYDELYRLLDDKNINHENRIAIKKILKSK